MEVLRPHEISFPLNTDFEVVGALHQHLCPELGRSKVVRPQPSPGGTVAKQCVEPPAVIGVRCSGRDDAGGCRVFPSPSGFPLVSHGCQGRFQKFREIVRDRTETRGKLKVQGGLFGRQKQVFFRSAPGSL